MHNDGVVVGTVEFQCSLNLSLNPACGDSTGSNRIEKGKVVYLLDLFEGRWEKGQCDLVCAAHLDNRANMLMSYSRAVSVVLILWGVGPILRNGCWI